MKTSRFLKVFRSMIAFILVLSLVMPYTASANTEQERPFKPGSQSESTLQLKAAIAEQLNLAEGGPKLHKDLQGLSGDERVNVIVHLSENPVALTKGIAELAGKKFSTKDANEVKQKVVKQQHFVQKQMASLNISHEVGVSYNTVLNGFATSVKADDVEKLLLVDGVTLVEPDATVYAYEGEEAPTDEEGSEEQIDSVQDEEEESTNEEDVTQEEVEPVIDESDPTLDITMSTSIDFLGIEALWAEGFEGQGIKVAVLDTGIDADHPEFQGIYKGGKNFVPHTGTDYARPRADDDASETSPLDRPDHRPEFNANGSSFYTSHGTHVAGTIAAIGSNEYGIKGIAPKVDLYAYRVLGAYGSGSTSGIIKAIDTAVIEGMDVINLSLGGGANSETDGASFALNNAMLAGTIAVSATGNSGPNRGTMGTPATSRLGIAVGNTTNPEAHFNGDVSVTAGDFTYAQNLQLMGTTFGANLTQQLAGEFDLIAVPGVGKVTDYAGLDVTGKVALVSRGEIAFVDKIAAAKDNGAVAVIVHNFAGGSNAPNPSGVFLGDAFEFIPTFDMSVTDGEAIRAALAQAEGTITFSNFDNTLTTGDDVNNSSSRGPSKPNFDIKPDVTAPGTNIMSAIPMYKADFPEATYEHAYTRKTGTSMATPHIAGIAALVKQANPTWNAFDVKVALSNTAKVLDTSKYDVFAQGAGRVQAYQAAHPEILAYAIDTANNDGEIVENLKGTVTFGPQSLEEDLSVNKQILVKNEYGNGGTYNATVEVTKGFGDATVTIDNPTFTLTDEQLLNVTLTASANTDTKPGDEILGYIHITGGRTDVSLPFAADFGGEAAAEVKDMSITETDLSFNGDGVKDEAMLYFTITGDVGFNFVELWDIMNPDGGAYKDGYIGYLHAGTSLSAGSYQLPIRGQYRPWGGSGPTTIPDGLYTIDFSGETVSGNPPVIGDYVGPVVVKSTAGTVTGTIEGTTATGAIDDAYIIYQQELVNYGLGYDINTKLHASYEVKSKEEVVASGPITLAQDGTYTFELPNLEKANHTVIVKYEDAAGNQAEAVIRDVEYTLNDQLLALQKGETADLVLTETTTIQDGTSTERDVTADATFSTADATIATVEAGTITAVKAGTTEITVTYGDFTETVVVEVTGLPTYAVDSTELSLVAGGNHQIVVTQTTILPTGDADEVDVTAEATFTVADDTVVTVEGGKVTAVNAGTTEITVTYGDFTETVVVKVWGAPEYELSQTDILLLTGSTKQLKLTQSILQPDGKTIDTKDVTADALYVSSDEKILTVDKGLIKTIRSGKATITVTYDGSAEMTVNVVVSDPVIVYPDPTPPVDPKPEEKPEPKPDPEKPTPPVFTDITNTFAANEINKLAAKGIIQGKTETNFAPNAQISRAEFAVLLARALELELKDYEGTFGDVNASKKWAFAGVEAAARAGIINGTADGKFNPDAPIKREEIAAMVIRAIEYKDKEVLKGLDTPANFKDHGSIGSFAIDSVYKANALGVVKGSETGSFNPKNNATRAEAAVMLYRALNKLKLID
ncbi:S8 family serine peptidase [Sporosarcina sp. ITBMC105]